jgi:DNA helicase-2/ATP-dependent DNA helicase PcrA
MNDTSEQDYAIAKIVADQHKNVFAVGDIDQTIFSFRGAEIRNIERLKMAFPDHLDVVLNTTYRCPAVIANACNRLISNNQYNVSGKVLTSTKTEGCVEVDEYGTEDDEAVGIASLIKAMHTGGVPFEHIAILCRTHAVGAHIAQNLTSQNIPVVIAGTKLKFLDLEEIRMFHSLLKVAQNPLDSLPFERVMRMTHLGIRRSKVAAIKAQAAAMNIPIIEAALHSYRDSPEDDRQWLLDIKTLYDADFKDQVQIAHKWLDDVYRTEGLATRRVSLKELLGFIENWRLSTTQEVTLENYLAHLHEVTSQDDIHDDEESVRLMTLHASKGLEFPVVFIPALENLIFPLNNLADTSEKIEMIEEERRLMYVGMSRSMDTLRLSHVRNRVYRGQDRQMTRSIFLEEISE